MFYLNTVSNFSNQKCFVQLFFKIFRVNHIIYFKQIKKKGIKFFNFHNFYQLRFFSIFMVRQSGNPKNMSKIYKIAIDGHAASGKSTSAKKIAEILNFDHINSGNVYRALLFVYFRRFGKQDSITKLNIEEAKFLKEIEFKIIDNNYYYLNGKPCQLRTEEIDRFVASFASIEEVRKIAFKIQKNLIASAKRGVVMDGRDITTKIMPDADLKVFMTASPEKRAERRLVEKKRGDIGTLIQEIKSRDEIDEKREHGALKKTEDCFFVENNDLSFDSQVSLIIDRFKKVSKY